MAFNSVQVASKVKSILYSFNMAVKVAYADGGSTTTKGLLGTVTKKDMDDNPGTVQSSMMKLLLPGTIREIHSGDSVSIKNIEYAVVYVEKVAPTNSPVLYKAYLQS